MGKRKLQSTLKYVKKRDNKKIKLPLEIDKEKDSIVIDKKYKNVLEEAKQNVETGKKEYCRIEEEVKKGLNDLIKKEKTWIHLYTLKIYHLDLLLKDKDLCFGKFTNKSYEIISKNMDKICDLTEDVNKTELERYNKYSKENAKAYMAKKEAKDEYYRVRERLKKEGESLIKKEKHAEHIQKEKMKYLKKVFKTEKLNPIASFFEDVHMLIYDTHKSQGIVGKWVKSSQLWTVYELYHQFKFGKKPTVTFDAFAKTSLNPYKKYQDKGKGTISLNYLETKYTSGQWFYKLHYNSGSKHDDERTQEEWEAAQQKALEDLELQGGDSDESMFWKT